MSLQGGGSARCVTLETSAGIVFTILHTLCLFYDVSDATIKTYLTGGGGVDPPPPHSSPPVAADDVIVVTSGNGRELSPGSRRDI